MNDRFERRERQRRATARRRRIAVLAALGAVLCAAAWVVAPIIRGGSPVSSSSTVAAASEPAPAKPKPAVVAAKPTLPPQQRIKPLVPGVAKVITEVPTAGNEVALTFDDGTCASCVKRIVDFLEKSGTHATFFPNGTYGASWDPQAARIRALVENGQLTLGNHTFSHGAATQIGSAAFGADLQRNEAWIEKTFKLTGRPWVRPPYGDYNSGTLAAAGEAGYKRVIMWSGTVADSDLRSEPYILNAIHYWAKPGRIILMHANYPPTSKALPKILKILQRKHLQPVTIAELLKGA
ncbi:MAG: polysaccharide deacetylase family protein [Actinomycetes bacterium]